MSDVELSIVDPHGPSLDWGPLDLLAVAGDPVQYGFDMPTIGIDVDAAVFTIVRACLEHGDAPDVHWLIGRLRPEKPGVLGGQAFVRVAGHWLFSSADSRLGAFARSVP